MKTETITLDEDSYLVEWLAHESFDDGDWTERWFVEGDSKVNADDGKLWIRNPRGDKGNAATVWFRTDLPDDAIVRFTAMAAPPVERNAANINLFLHGRELDGSPVRFGRNGVYQEYHGFPNYIVTLTGGYKDGWSRLRRDPGFHLLHEAADVRSDVGVMYDIVVSILGGRLRYYINGQKVHDVRDPDPLPGGKFGIRTWSTDGWWSDVRFGAISET